MCPWMCCPIAFCDSSGVRLRHAEKAAPFPPTRRYLRSCPSFEQLIVLERLEVKRGE